VIVIACSGKFYQHSEILARCRSGTISVFELEMTLKRAAVEHGDIGRPPKKCFPPRTFVRFGFLL
jgi:hypothetical protein